MVIYQYNNKKLPFFLKTAASQSALSKFQQMLIMKIRSKLLYYCFQQIDLGISAYVINNLSKIRSFPKGSSIDLYTGKANEAIPSMIQSRKSLDRWL